MTLYSPCRYLFWISKAHTPTWPPPELAPPPLPGAAVYNSHRPHHQAEASSHRWEHWGRLGTVPLASASYQDSAPSSLRDNAPATTWSKGDPARFWVSVWSAPGRGGRGGILGVERGRLGTSGHSLLARTLPTENEVKRASLPLLFNHPRD